jgi:hypothetical protein
MGIILAVILFFNCLGAVFFVPALILLFKPRFLTKDYVAEEKVSGVASATN